MDTQAEATQAAEAVDLGGMATKAKADIKQLISLLSRVPRGDMSMYRAYYVNLEKTIDALVAKNGQLQAAYSEVYAAREAAVKEFKAATVGLAELRKANKPEEAEPQASKATKKANPKPATKP